MTQLARGSFDSGAASGVWDGIHAHASKPLSTLFVRRGNALMDRNRQSRHAATSVVWPMTSSGTCPALAWGRGKAQCLTNSRTLSGGVTGRVMEGLTRSSHDLC